MRALLALALVARAAAADTVTGVDETHVHATLVAFGQGHTLEQDDVLAWHATGDRATIDRAEHHRTQDGRPADDSPSDDQEQIAKARRFETQLIAVLGAQSFTADVPVAIPDDQLAALHDAQNLIRATKVVATWTGTTADVAHYRAYVIFTIGSTGVAGQATLAGSLDIDPRRHALIDARLSAVLATGGLVQLAGTASAHLTRSYR